MMEPEVCPATLISIDRKACVVMPPNPEVRMWVPLIDSDPSCQIEVSPGNTTDLPAWPSHAVEGNLNHTYLIKTF